MENEKRDDRETQCETKFVYIDNERTKVIRGHILSQDQHSFTIRTLRGDVITLGKCRLVKAYPAGGE